MAGSLDNEGVTALIGAVYDAALDSALWPRVQDALGDAVNSSLGVLFFNDVSTNQASIALHPNWDPSEIERYERDYAVSNPLTLDALRQPLGSVRSDTMLPDYERYRRSAVYNEFFAPNDAQHMLGSFAIQESGRAIALAFHRGTAHGPFTAHETGLFGTVLPHIVRSFHLRHRFAQPHAMLHGVGEVLSRMNRAAMLVAANGRVREMNALAERVAAAGDGIGVAGGRFSCGFAPARDALLRLVARTAGKERAPPASAVVSVERPSGRRPYQVLVTPLPMKAAWWGLAGKSVALVLIHDPEDVPLSCAERLAATYCLTAAEARLAEAIGAGRTLDEYAASVAVTRNTVRWLLKQAMSKMGARSQTEVVRLAADFASLPSTVGSHGNDPGEPRLPGEC